MSPIQMERCSIERLDFGKMGYGCKHYRRRCRIRAPCCNEIYPCRRCHNEATVVCLVCDTEQPASRVCTNCGVRVGEYFCEICKFYDDDIDKGLFHCDDCGICRVGGRDQFFHCKKCVFGRIIHASRILRHHCSICYEFLFDSMKHTTGMKCGHTMHTECYYEMLKHDVYCCPICSKSVIYMLRNWKRIDEEIKATITFRNYRRKVWIVCRDCNGTTDVYFNMVGQKCSHYKSCNTSSIAPPPVLSQ